MFDRSRVQSGDTVYDCDGNKIGTVTSAESGYLDVSSGFLGINRLYIPYSEISRAGGGAIYLNVAKDNIQAKGWHQRPSEQSQATGAAGTMAAGASGYRTNAPQSPNQPGTPTRQTMPLREETEVPVEQRKQVGEVNIGKRVEENRQSYQVPVTHDEVNIQERPVNRPAEQGPTGQGEIRVPVYEEEVKVEKQPRVYGEVEVTKQPVTEERTVSGTVRKEVPEVHKEGNLDDDVRDELDNENVDDRTNARRNDLRNP
jgi:uncharacterized protein (TIGR02271 family)